MGEFKEEHNEHNEQNQQNSHFSSRLILALSNVFALVPIVFAHTLAESGLVMFAACASVCMHMTETKHGIEPSKRLARWSSVVLNVDRLAAIATALHFGGVWMRAILHPQNSAQFCAAQKTLELFLVGLCASAFGELSTHVPTYVAMHLLWHAAAYGSVVAVEVFLQE